MTEQPDGHLPITFCVAGVQKAATTTLHAILVRHPQIARPAKKELHFFDSEKRSWDPPDYSDYRSVRTKPSEIIAGETTPMYLFWPQALERMHAYRPSMQLIASFRDPIERAFSQWTMHAGLIDDFPPFQRIVDRWTRGVLPEDLPEAGPQRAMLRTRSLVDRGLYGAQLQRAFAIFPREQWLLLNFEQIVSDPDAVAQAMTDFLGLKPFKRFPKARQTNRSRTDLTGKGEPLTGELISRIAQMYADDLATFAELSGIDVSNWSTSRIIAGTLQPDDLAHKLSAKAGLV